MSTLALASPQQLFLPTRAWGKGGMLLHGRIDHHYRCMFSNRCMITNTAWLLPGAAHPLRQSLALIQSLTHPFTHPFIQSPTNLPTHSFSHSRIFMHSAAQSPTVHFCKKISKERTEKSGCGRHVHFCKKISKERTEKSGRGPPRPLLQKDF